MSRRAVWRRCTVAVLLPLGTLSAQDPETVLRSTLRFEVADISRLRAGEVVARLVPTGNQREVVVAGAVALSGAFEPAATRLLDLRALLAALPTRRTLTVLGGTPRAEDFAAWRLEREDLSRLVQCRVGDCDSKLPTALIDSMAQVPWGTADATGQAEALLRTWVAQYAALYRRHGRDSMVVYADRREPGPSAAILLALHTAPPSLREHAPALSRHLLEYPRGSWPGASDLLAWAVDRLPGARPTFTLRHAASWRHASQPLALVAEQVLWANHYLDGELGLTGVVTDPVSAQPWLVIVRRFHFDNLPGGLMNIRGRVRDRTLQALRAELAARRTQLGSR